MKFLTNIDLNKNQLLNARLQQLSSHPSNPVSGQVYYNTNDDRVYAYSGSSWVDMTVALGGTLNNSVLTGLPIVKSSVTKASGDSSTEVFRIESSDSQPLFQVMTNGDTVIAGVLTVNGTGESMFAGDVSIGGNLNVDGNVSGGTQVDLAEDLTVTGTLIVKGDTSLGDDSSIDTTTIKGVTTIYSPTTKALGNGTNDAFRVLDSAGANLFNVKTNGDTVIAGVLTVNGTGDSTFAGNVNIGGSLNVDGTISGGTQVSLAEDLDITGNLNVKGNTVLGDNASQDTTTIKGLTTIYSSVLKSNGSSDDDIFAIKDSGGTDLFNVKTNGDTVIAGVLTVNGAGQSTFNGDVSINGKLTVAQDATVSADMSADNFTVQGNLIVNGDTTIGDASSDNITVKGSAVFEQPIDMSSKRIMNVADPVDGKDVANKSYVDSLSLGLDVKQSVKVATTGNIVLSGTQSIDGVALSVNDRVLVKDQTSASQNGIYIVKSGVWERSEDADSSEKVTSGMFTFVEDGNVNSDSGWVLSTDGAIVLGTTNLSFVQFSGAGSIDAGNGLTKSGNRLNVVGTTNRIVATEDAIDISSNYVGQTSITTLGTVTTGTWNASTIAVSKGGTGATNASSARANLGATGKYSSTIGNGSSSTFTITHNLNSDDIVVSIKELSTGNHVFADIQVVDANSIKVYFGSAPTSNSYRVVVVG